MQIQCSNCGSVVAFRFGKKPVNRLIQDGWNSFGSALYCPACSETWPERNGATRSMAGAENTTNVIRRLHTRKSHSASAKCLSKSD